MTAAWEDADGEGELIGRCYTKARRTPLVYGAIPGGAGRSLRLPLGPYTLTQLAALVGAFIVLILSRPLWGGHGLADVLVLLGVPFGFAFALRQLHIDGRNPAAATASVLMMLTGPRQGRLHGRPWRPPRLHRTDTVITLAPGRPPQPPATEHTEAPAARPAAPAPRKPAASSLPDGQPRRSPEPLDAVKSPVATGVQALLARRAPARPSQED